MGSFDDLEPEVASFAGDSWFSNGHGVIWYYDTLSAGMRAYPVAMREGIHQIAEEVAQQAEAYMKENAPWSDRSGDARAGLTAEARSSLVTESLVLYHTVDYGIWLETRWSGAYAIIVPTVERYGAEFMAALEGVRLAL